VRKAIAAFKRTNNLPTDDKLDAATWTALVQAASEPVLTEYVLTEDDVKGPFLAKLPSKMEDLKHLRHLGYESAVEGIGEKFHMSEQLLKALNPAKAFDKAGVTIVVANLRSEPFQEKITQIEIDKAQRILRAFAKDGRLLAVYPASIGSKEKPAPSGTYKVASITRNPFYKYNPEYRFKGVKAKTAFTIKPGPNNPVGSVWISLSLKGYGIHGTPSPSKVSKTESHGCIRLTNWDALGLASAAEKGATVTFLEQSSSKAKALDIDGSPIRALASQRGKF
jgi:lipoprotein-anchoring transpeptidase ErfK/SrfK